MTFKKRLLIPAILILTFVLGTSGFMIIEGWDFEDSLYMTVLTLTTVGYEEVHHLSSAGRYFNMFMLLLGVATATFALTRIITDIASIDFDQRRRSKMKKKIAELKDHTIVCGFGRMGEVICKRLSEYHNNFVVIEKRPALIEELKKTKHLYVEGDAANDDNLYEAGIEKAKVLVSVIDNDSDGLYIALAGRSINPKLFIIVRSNDEKAKKRIIRAGANRVVLPFVMSGEKVANNVINPATEDLFDFTDGPDGEDQKIQLADLFVNEESLIKNKSLDEVGEKLSNLIIIGIKNQDNSFNFKPGSKYIFQKGDCLIAMGPQKDYIDAKRNLKLG